MSGLISRLVGAARYRPGQVLQVEGWPVRLSVNPRSRRISLRIDRARREAVASAPSERRLAAAAEFALSRAAWIGRRLEALPASAPLAPGMELAVFGTPVSLQHAPGRARLSLSEGLLSAPADAAFATRAVRLIKAQAVSEFTRLTAGYAERLGRPLPTVRVTDPRRRWGSCSPASPGRAASIRYSWRLALAPPEVADYVAAHECAHLVIANHGPAFWSLVESIYGPTAAPRAWLNVHGDRLHAVTL